MRPYEIKNSVEMAQLIAAYEEVHNVPCEERLTRWYGDYGLYEFISEISEEKFEEAKNKALSALGITEAEFLNCEFRRAHLRTYEDIVAQMRRQRDEELVEAPYVDEKRFDDIKRRHQEELAEYKKECSLYIRKEMAAILALTTMEDYQDKLNEIYARYEEIVSLALEENVCLFAVDSFVEFLTERGQKSAAREYKAKVEALRDPCRHKHGHWTCVDHDLGYSTLQCSVCYKETVLYDGYEDPTHCSCGARMEGRLKNNANL